MEGIERKHPKFFRILSTSVHAVGAIHFVFASYYDWFHVHIPPEISPIYSAFGYKLKFLTYWDALTQAAYFTYCFILDLVGLKQKETKDNIFCRIKDYFEASIAFPISMFVGVTFWGLMAVDRELVLPAALDPYFPAWLNHMVHSNIVLFQFLEILTSKRNYPKKKYGLIGLFIYQTTYLMWMHIVYLKSGLWVYPIFEKLNIPGRIGFFAGSILFGFVFYFIGEKINYYLWKRTSEEISHPNVEYEKKPVAV